MRIERDSPFVSCHTDTTDTLPVTADFSVSPCHQPPEELLYFLAVPSGGRPFFRPTHCRLQDLADVVPLVFCAPPTSAGNRGGEGGPSVAPRDASMRIMGGG